MSAQPEQVQPFSEASSDKQRWTEAMRQLGEVTSRLLDQAPARYQPTTPAWQVAGVVIEVAILIDSPCTFLLAVEDLERRVIADWTRP